MKQITDDLLVESYQKAVSLNLHNDFIELLLEELYRRDLLQNIPKTMITTADSPSTEHPY